MRRGVTLRLLLFGSGKDSGGGTLNLIDAAEVGVEEPNYSIHDLNSIAEKSSLKTKIFSYLLVSVYYHGE